MSNTYQSSRPAPKAPRKVTKKTRTVRVVNGRERGEENMVEITERGPRLVKTCVYWVKVITSAWGFATVWTKFAAAGGEVYECNIGGPGSTFTNDYGEQVTDEGPEVCSCLGHLQHGHCKHVSATRALLAAGKL